MSSLRGLRVAVYARYSSDAQRESSIEDQLRVCRAFVERHGGAVEDARVYSDAAISAASLERPGFQRMMAALVGKARTIDVLVVESQDRLSRNVADGARLLEQLQFYGVRLLSVNDGLDTASRGSKLTYAVKSLLSDLYIDDLREKTRRGLEGRALAGFSTGGLPYGYRSEPVSDGRGGTLGFRVLVDEAEADVVRRIYREYAAGRSLSGLAAALNADRVPPPRGKGGRRGWVASTIRDMLRRSMYRGITTFNKREWRKIPGTNCRRYKTRPDADVIRSMHPDRQIVDDELWDAVRARASSVAEKYKAAGDRLRASVGRGSYPLSGLLACGVCGAPMTIAGGSSASYYRCSDNKKRGTAVCANARTVREDETRTRILEAVEQSLATPEALTHLRKRIAERLGELSRTTSRELEERRARLARTEERIAGLVEFIATGDRSDYVRKALADLEHQANEEKKAIGAVLESTKTPIRLPTPAEVVACALDLKRVLDGDPALAREALRKLFKGGRITMLPQEDGSYLARGEFLPLVALSAAENTNAPGRKAGGAWSSDGCAGRI
ncbi:MAG: recombinase family protein [Polyangiaceae bacterium]